MKTRILLLCLILFYVGQLMAQNEKKSKFSYEEKCYEENNFFPKVEKSKLISYDFSKGTFDKLKVNVRRNEPIAILIKNINPFFYRISVKSDDKTISYQNADSENLNTIVQEIQQMNYYKIQEQYSFEYSIAGLIVKNSW